MTTHEEKPKKKITTFLALSPFIVIFAFLVLFYVVLGIRPEPTFIICLAATFGIGIIFAGKSYDQLLKAGCARVGKTMSAILIIFSIGIVVGTFMYSGAIPTLVVYGIKIISPNMFYLTALLACMIISIACGSSLTTVGTLGIALYAMASVMGVDMKMTLGAIWCGAIFGDSCSPVSDGPNMNAAVTRVDLYKLVGNNLKYSFGPAYVPVIIFYLVLSLNAPAATAVENDTINTFLTEINTIYNISPICLLPFIILFLSIIVKVPAVPALIGSAFSAIIVGLALQPFSFNSAITCMNTGFTLNMIPASVIDTATLSSTTTNLLVRGGMANMVGLVCVIIMAQMIVAIIEECGFMDHLMHTLFSKAKTPRSLMLAATLTGLCLAPCGGNAYLPTIITGTMYQRPFLENKMDLVNLARINLAGTGISCSMWPWLVVGTYYYTNLGVTPPEFAMYCVALPLAILTLVISALTGWGIVRLTDEEAAAQLAELDEGKS